MKQLFAFLFLLTFIPTTAFSWAHMVTLRQRDGLESNLYLIARDKGVITYTLDIRSTDFSRDSIKLQTEKALTLWLNGLGVRAQLKEVAATARDFDLKIDIGSQTEEPQLRGYNISEEENGRFRSFIHINSEFVDLSEGQYYHMTDTKNLLGDKLPSFLDEVSFTQGLSVLDAGRTYGINWLALWDSSYRILVHEIGHSFGLADTYEENLDFNGDPEFRSKEQPSSVMKDSLYFYLTKDDLEGLQALKKRLQK